MCDTFDQLIKIINCKNIDLVLLESVIDKLCFPSCSIDDLFTFRFIIALNHGLITLENYKQDTIVIIKDDQNIKVEWYNLTGLDFVNYENPINNILKSSLVDQNSTKLYSKYCIYLNRLVLNILTVKNKDSLINLPTFSSLSLKNQTQLLNLYHIISHNLVAQYPSHFRYNADSLVDEVLTFLDFSLVKIDLLYSHFEQCMDKKIYFEFNLNEFNKLIRYATNLDLFNPSRFTSVLIHAAENRYTDCLSMLIENGATLDYINHYGMTAIIYAALYDHVECLKILIDSGANIDVQQKHGKTPLMYAAKNGNLECLKLLIASGANINICSNDELTPIMFSAKYGHTECLKFLIESGADLEIQLYNGMSALKFAQQYSYSDCINLLMEHLS